MTVKSLAQGQGQSTEFKMRGLQAAFAINLRIYQAKFGGCSRYRYFHFDLNSGNGYNETVGCIGSPLAFLEAVNETGCKWIFAGFCDLDHEKLAILFDRPELQREDCFAFHGDNSELAYAIPEIIRGYGENPQQAVGMILADPNGADIPLESLAWLSHQCPKIDFVVNWNSARAKGNRINPVYGGDHYPTLSDVLRQMNKRYWLIRQPLTAHQFTVLVGRNFKIGDHRSLGFHHLDSSAGQAIFRRCNFTNRELAGFRQAAYGELAL